MRCTERKPGNGRRDEVALCIELLQMRAANDGMILESKGEYAKLQKSQTK